MTNKRIKNKKEVSETGEILRIVNYIFLVIAFFLEGNLELKNITAGGAGVSAAQTIVVNIYTISKNLKELVKNGINDEVVKQIQNNSEGMVFKRSEEKYSDILNEICQDAIKNALF